jgi:hypothetical protein
MVASKQVIVVEIVLGSVRRDGLTVTPSFGQIEPQVQLRQVPGGSFQLLERHMPSMHE